NDDVVMRSELRGAIYSRPHRLALIVTECCASYPERIRGVPPSDKPANVQTLEKLFFTSTAMVDVNACEPGDVSQISDTGSFFTSAFTRALTRAPEELSPNGPLGWSTLMTEVSKLVDATYRPTNRHKPHFF